MTTKRYDRLPFSFIWVKRIETILEQEGLSAPKTQTFAAPGHPRYCFAADVIAVMWALKQKKINAFRAERVEILRTWDEVRTKCLWRRLGVPSFGKTELATELTGAFECSTEKAGEIVEHVIRSLEHALLSRRKVEFRGFGELVVTERAAKIGRDPKNPSKGAISISIPPRIVVKFKVSKELDTKLNMAAISVQEALRSVIVEEPTNARLAARSTHRRRWRSARSSRPVPLTLNSRT